MQKVRDFVGINIEGWVRNEEFEKAREKARQKRGRNLTSTGHFRIARK
jgi:hypothetical protein